MSRARNCRPMRRTPSRTTQGKRASKTSCGRWVVTVTACGPSVDCDGRGETCTSRRRGVCKAPARNDPGQIDRKTGRAAAGHSFGANPPGAHEAGAPGPLPAITRPFRHRRESRGDADRQHTGCNRQPHRCDAGKYATPPWQRPPPLRTKNGNWRRRTR